MNIKNFVYTITCISFCIPFGAGVYEHVAVWPNAWAALPKSLSMLQGEYGLESTPFWVTIHPFTLLLLITSLILHWKTDRKKNILIALVIYFLILVITSIYFVPELIDISSTPYSDTLDSALQKRGDMWVICSLIRGGIGFIAAYFLIIGLTKSELKKQIG